MDALSYPCKNILTRRANQRHNCIVPQLQNAHGPAQQRALRRDCTQKTLTHNRSSTGSPTRRIASRVAEPRALPMGEPEEIST
jgi:hypothetical protein